MGGDVFLIIVTCFEIHKTLDEYMPHLRTSWHWPHTLFFPSWYFNCLMIVPAELKEAINRPQWKMFFEEVAFMQRKCGGYTCKQEDVVEVSDFYSVGGKRMHSCR
jgi:hypothetical protein